MQTLPRSTRIRVPPIKSQGIKTKIVPLIMSSVRWDGKGRWIEPFMGSGAVVFNVQPSSALITDTNKHIIDLYKAIQNGSITPHKVRAHLEAEGNKLLRQGEEYYYSVRDRFNAEFDPLDFLFLNRSCFNGVIRFNKKGKFNVPFCKKTDRFRQAYVTKICNQVAWVQRVFEGRDWIFKACDYTETLAEATGNDFIYVDPPYVGRHADYYNDWTEADADNLAAALRNTRSGFAYSMWLENQHRKNTHLERWFSDYPMFTFSHFYHVGATESLRGAMQEALIVSSQNAVNGEDGIKILNSFHLSEDEQEDDIIGTLL